MNANLNQKLVKIVFDKQIATNNLIIQKLTTQLPTDHCKLIKQISYNLLLLPLTAGNHHWWRA